MSLSFDVYWSFRSPYSYLATPRLREIAGTYDVTVNIRPVYPLAVRKANFFENVDPLWLSYTIKDVLRLAQMYDIPLGFPNPDPIVQNIETREIAADQPYIYRLTRLGMLAAEQGIALEFIYQVGTLIWSGEVNWTEGDHLARAVERAGGDLALMDAEIVARADALDQQIERHHVQQRGAGHWGVPLMVFEGEPFFGHDRVDALLWRMQQHGLTKR